MQARISDLPPNRRSVRLFGQVPPVTAFFHGALGAIPAASQTVSRISRTRVPPGAHSPLALAQLLAAPPRPFSASCPSSQTSLHPPAVNGTANGVPRSAMLYALRIAGMGLEAVLVAVAQGRNQRWQAVC